ncbi:16S rRNA (guanine(966)-N(2))-methyltransferase RsmD [Actinoplanes couchii]|uniref:DNA methylase n=1 Tax=Actinoplanes couchii TaxID=403638 RepID=A0ABQ3X5H8_9ACTN|nr:16S rRNA (guanine(966)-N(2))-methyltransferase RsmD [Actinoplanes couchii]MDR6325535.1 16S rRNA (guanine966-N2)-methyltransferase [Actinoplanes couchii]GID53765.1 DNA methylase [Actinoplanes couchii]
MTRIIAGVHGGRRLTAPSGPLTRPTSDRVREAFFSALESMTDLSGARVADLYAGSGAIGLESLSRGADHALLVEADAKAARVIRDNIVLLKVGPAAKLVTGKVLQVLADRPAGGRYDVVFADPPYVLGDDEIDSLQRELVANDWLAEDAVVVFERSRRSGPMNWVDGLAGDRTRRYGDTTLWYGRRS